MPKLELNQVMLPWAPHDWEHAMRVASARVQQEAVQLRVAPDRLRISARGGSDEGPAPTPPGPALYAPALRSAGLPLEPHPSLADEDRSSLDEQGLVAAAVALDVLATRTRKLAATPTLLAELADTLRSVGGLGGVESENVPALLAHARSRSGTARAALCLTLAGNLEDAHAGAAVTTPESLWVALRRVEQAAGLVVREARLRLEARDKVNYRQG